MVWSIMEGIGFIGQVVGLHAEMVCGVFSVDRSTLV